MNENNYLKKFTRSIKIESHRYSCLMLALQDARKIAGRNILNGQITNDILENDQSFMNPYSFVGVVNYLLILELIGEIFRLKTFSTNKSNKIYKALKQFSASDMTMTSLNERDIDTIIALRNSLAHNYGLINIPSEKEKKTKLHKFILLNNDNSELIKYPMQIWNEDFADKSEETSTQISVIKLQDLVERVFLNLTTEIENDTVDLALEKGLDELKARFTILQ